MSSSVPENIQVAALAIQTTKHLVEGALAESSSPPYCLEVASRAYERCNMLTMNRAQSDCLLLATMSYAYCEGLMDWKTRVPILPKNNK